MPNFASSKRIIERNENKNKIYGRKSHWQVVNKLSITFFHFVPKSPFSGVFRCQMKEVDDDSAAIRLPLQPFRIKALKVWI